MNMDYDDYREQHERPSDDYPDPPWSDADHMADERNRAEEHGEYDDLIHEAEG